MIKDKVKLKFQMRLFSLRVSLGVCACCMDMSATMTRQTSSESSHPAPRLCVTSCRPYQSWWRWCVSRCLSTGCTLCASTVSSEGEYGLLHLSSETHGVHGDVK